MQTAMQRTAMNAASTPTHGCGKKYDGRTVRAFADTLKENEIQTL